jgi:hypothetical protein
MRTFVWGCSGIAAVLLGHCAMASPDNPRAGSVVMLPGRPVAIPVPPPGSNADAANPASVGDVITQRGNNLRTGTTQHGGLDQQAVGNGHFGLITQWNVDGVVLAQPLFMADVNFPQGRRSAVFIATASNWVYAFNADPPFDKLWEHQLGEPFRITNPWNAKTNNPEPKVCLGMEATEQEDGARPQVVTMGIESTPVIDPERRLIFVSYRKMDGSLVGTQRISALELGTGRFAKASDGHDLDRPVTDDLVWNRVHQNRASLLLDGGLVYIGFSGRCEGTGMPFYEEDHPFQGWIYAFDARELAFAGRYRSTQDPVGARRVDPKHDPNTGGGIWQASTGLASDGHGNLFFATGNALHGSAPPDALGKNLTNSVVRLHIEPLTDRPLQSQAVSMTVADWFTPYRKAWLDPGDFDFAAAGVVLIPRSRYLFAAGKEGILYVLDRGNLGKFDNGEPIDVQSMLDGHTSEDPIGLDVGGRDQVVQKFRVGVNQYCAAGAAPVFCLGKGEQFRSRAPGYTGRGVALKHWIMWPHVHGTPVFGAFPDGSAFMYIWPEKDFLKAFRWWGKRFDTEPTLATALGSHQLVLAPPYLADHDIAPGMPGGMLTLTVDGVRPGAGVLFASVQRCRSNAADPSFHECSLARCRATADCAEQRFGMLRAFDPMTLRELWNNQGDRFGTPESKDYWFAKFVPPTIAHGCVFLATASGRVLVYGKR